MNRHWVINASPLILLGKIGTLNLLPQLADTLVIPQGVVEEIGQGKDNDQAKLWLKYEGKRWIQPNRFTNPLVASWGLGLGETEVISYALTHPEYIAIIDDRAARNCALSLKVPVRGTLGVLLLAKMTGKINQVTPFIKQLQEAGLRINQKLRAEVIKLAKEDG